MPMISKATESGRKGKSRATKSGPKKINKSEKGSQAFLYVWRLRDIESKNVAHVSTRVDLQHKAASVTPLKVIKRNLRGDAQLNSAYFGGFVVVLETGELMILDTSTCELHSTGCDVELLSNKVLSTSCVNNQVRVVHSKEKGQVSVSTFSLREYPCLELEQSCILHGCSPEDRIACQGDRVVSASSGGNILAYKLSDGVSVDLQPMLRRQIMLGRSGGRSSKGSKRSYSSSEPANSHELCALIDSSSRGFFVRSEKGCSHVAVIDLVYGSVLWAGALRHEGDGSATQVRYLRVRNTHEVH